MSITYCFGFFRFPVYFSVFLFFFSLQRWRWAEGEILFTLFRRWTLFVCPTKSISIVRQTNKVHLLSYTTMNNKQIFYYTLFFMYIFVIDPITTNFKARLHSRDTTVHFWTMNGCYIYLFIYLFRVMLHTQFASCACTWRELFNNSAQLQAWRIHCPICVQIGACSNQSRSWIL